MQSDMAGTLRADMGGIPGLYNIMHNHVYTLVLLCCLQSLYTDMYVHAHVYTPQQLCTCRFSAAVTCAVSHKR